MDLLCHYHHHFKETVMFKNILLPAILLFALVFSGCDVIDPPYTEKTNGGGDDTSEKVRKVLLEDYTGFTCKNCPIAHGIAHDLQESYGSRLVVISIHAGAYAEPTEEHTYDFRTDAGDELDDYFGVSEIGNPNGTVNRKEFSGKRVLGPYYWEAVVAELMELDPEIAIKLTPSYNESTRVISVDVDVEYLAEGNANHHLSVFMLEDHVIQYQLNKLVEPNDVEDYDHRHVLRGSMNGTWGEQLSTSNIASGMKFKKSYSYTISGGSDWNPDNMSIVAFVHDKGASFEVIQVEEKKLK
jgi:hypothetical protein